MYDEDVPHPKDRKDTNPKDAIGDKKLPLALLSGIAKIQWCLAHLEGMLKYGAWNWRSAGVRASIYISAIDRHLDKYKAGEDRDPVSRVHHLGNVMASCAILMEADVLGKLTDDRGPRTPASELIDEAQEGVLHLQQLYGDVQPHHYTIEDTPCLPESRPMNTTESITEPQKPRSSERPETKPVEKLWTGEP